MIFLVNTFYPIYWLFDPFLFLKMFQRKLLEKKFKETDEVELSKNSNQVEDIENATVKNKLNNEPKINYSYTQRELNR